MSVCSSADCNVDPFARGDFDDELVDWYHPWCGQVGRLVLTHARMYNKCFGKKVRSRKHLGIAWGVAFLPRPRNIVTGLLASRSHMTIGQVARHQANIYLHHLVGRRIGAPSAAMRVHSTPVTELCTYCVHRCA